MLYPRAAATRSETPKNVATEKEKPGRTQLTADLTGKWTQKASMPTKRMAHAMCVVDGKIYVIDGVTNWDKERVVSAVEEL